MPPILKRGWLKRVKRMVGWVHTRARGRCACCDADPAPLGLDREAFNRRVQALVVPGSEAEGGGLCYGVPIHPFSNRS